MVVQEEASVLLLADFNKVIEDGIRKAGARGVGRDPFAENLYTSSDGRNSSCIGADSRSNFRSPIAEW
jgi:hypothetical protein